MTSLRGAQVSLARLTRRGNPDINTPTDAFSGSPRYARDDESINLLFLSIYGIITL